MFAAFGDPAFAAVWLVAAVGLVILIEIIDGRWGA